MNPTVSERRYGYFLIVTLLVLVFKVVKSSEDSSVVSPVSELNNVLLPDEV